VLARCTGNGRIRCHHACHEFLFVRLNAMPIDFVSTGKPLSPRERTLSKWILLCEDLVKVPLFGCQHCGECILSSTAFICSQRCPKRMRNGPCGGTGEGGTCEVHPDRKCVWYRIYHRSKALDRLSLLYKINKTHNWTLEGTSSWLNVLKNRIVPPVWRVRNDTQKVKELVSGDTQRKN
jgi:hypothetical protein